MRPFISPDTPKYPPILIITLILFIYSTDIQEVNLNWVIPYNGWTGDRNTILAARDLSAHRNTLCTHRRVVSTMRGLSLPTGLCWFIGSINDPGTVPDCRKGAGGPPGGRGQRGDGGHLVAVVIDLAVRGAWHWRYHVAVHERGGGDRDGGGERHLEEGRL